MSEPTSVTLSVGLNAVVVAATPGEPRVLAVTRPGRPDALPAGPLEAGHRTLETGLRSWVERLTGQSLGYVEQLYTLSGRDRTDGTGARALAVAYLALVREAKAAVDLCDGFGVVVDEAVGQEGHASRAHRIMGE